MKLISNKNFSTVLSYFPGVDYVNEWTEENPAIYYKILHQLQWVDYVIIPSFVNITSDDKFLLFRLDKDASCFLFSDEQNYILDIELYDYADYIYNNTQSKPSVPFLRGSIGKQNVIFINLDNPKTILAKISVNQQQYYYGEITSTNLYFSNKTMQFDYSSHWVRQWQNRIDGNYNDISGKINDNIKISQIERKYNNKQQFYIPLLRNGVYRNILPIISDNKSVFGGTDNLSFYSFTQMKNYFDYYCENQENKIIDDVYIRNQETIQGYSNNIIIRYKFVYYNNTNSQIQFHLICNGQCGFKIDDNQYFGNDVYFTSSSQYCLFQIYYYSNEYLSFEIQYIDYTSTYSRIPAYNLYLQNNNDNDIYIPLSNIFNEVSFRSYDSSALSFNENTSYNISVSDRKIEKNACICFWIKLDEIEQDGVLSIMKSDNVFIQRKDKNIKIIFFGQIEISFNLSHDKWHFICLNLSNKFNSVYVDMIDNQYKFVNFIGNYDNEYVFGKVNNYNTGYFSIHNIMIFNKVLNQNQINRIYNNTLCLNI